MTRGKTAKQLCPLVRVARLELAASWSQTRRPTNWATPGYEIEGIFPKWSNMWPKAILDQSRGEVKKKKCQRRNGFSDWLISRVQTVLQLPKFLRYHIIVSSRGLGYCRRFRERSQERKWGLAVPLGTARLTRGRSRAGKGQDAGAEGDGFKMGSGEGREDFVGDKVDFFVVPFIAAGDSAGFQIAP